MVLNRAEPAPTLHRLASLSSRRHLPDAFQYRLSFCTRTTGCRSRVTVFQFISRKRGNNALLLGPFRVRERARLNLKDQVLIADRVSARIGKGSLDRSFVLLGGCFVAVVGREFRTTRTREQIRKMAVGIEDNMAFRIGTKWLAPAAIRPHSLDCDP